MIRVTYGNNANRDVDFADKDVTIKQFLDEHEIDYSMGQMFLDGVTLQAGGLTKTFAELGYSDEEGKNTCYVMCASKTVNA